MTGPIADALALLDQAAYRQGKAVWLIGQAWQEVSAAARLTGQAYEGLGSGSPATTVNLANAGAAIEACLKTAKVIERDLNSQVASIRRLAFGGGGP